MSVYNDSIYNTILVIVYIYIYIMICSVELNDPCFDWTKICLCWVLRVEMTLGEGQLGCRIGRGLRPCRNKAPWGRKHAVKTCFTTFTTRLKVSIGRRSHGEFHQKKFNEFQVGAI